MEKERPQTHKKKKTGIEVEAVTIEEAIKKALKQLNAKENEVSVKAVKEEQKGLFGMEGQKLAKIQVTLKPRK